MTHFAPHIRVVLILLLIPLLVSSGQIVDAKEKKDGSTDSRITPPDNMFDPWPPRRHQIASSRRREH